MVVDTIKLTLPFKRSIATLRLFFQRVKLTKKVVGREFSRQQVTWGGTTPSLGALVSSSLLLYLVPTTGSLKRSVYMYFTRPPPRLWNHQYSYQLIILCLKFWRTDTGLQTKRSLIKKYILPQQNFFIIPFYILTIIIQTIIFLIYIILCL